MKIGTQIQALRKQQGITQETLAAEMGVTVGAVSKWENDITLPDILMLCSLADFFRVTTDELLGRSKKSTFMVCDDAPFIRDTLRELLEKEQSVKIIMLSADSTKEARQTAMTCGAEAYITKPFLPQHIITALERFADAHS